MFGWARTVESGVTMDSPRASVAAADVNVMTSVRIRNTRPMQFIIFGA
jgi:hypothetical protein